jgi:hypothetical protein
MVYFASVITNFTQVHQVSEKSQLNSFKIQFFDVDKVREESFKNNE